MCVEVVLVEQAVPVFEKLSKIIASMSNWNFSERAVILQPPPKWSEWIFPTTSKCATLLFPLLCRGLLINDSPVDQDEYDVLLRDKIFFVHTWCTMCIRILLYQVPGAGTLPKTCMLFISRTDSLVHFWHPQNRFITSLFFYWVWEQARELIWFVLFPKF